MIPYLKSVAQIHHEGRVIGTNADPLAILEHLQASDVVLVQNRQHLGIGVAWDAEHTGRIGTCGVVIHTCVANGVRRFEFGVSVTGKAEAFSQAFYDQT